MTGPMTGPITGIANRLSQTFEDLRNRRTGSLGSSRLAITAEYIILCFSFLPFIIPVGVLGLTGFLFLLNAYMFRGSGDFTWYHPFFALVCTLPALMGQLIAWAANYRSPFWWVLWVPGIVLFFMQPWHFADGWHALYMHDAFWGWSKDIIFNHRNASPQSHIGVISVLVMSMVTLMVAVRPWLRFSKWLGELNRGGEGGKSGTNHGGLPQADWASQRQVRSQFSNEGGIVLGEHTNPIDDTSAFDPSQPKSWRKQGRGKLITMNPADGNGHVVVLAASAGYKTSGIVIPNILHYDGPLVVFDPKGDLYARTRQARQDKGYKAIIIDELSGFDPFKMIAPLIATSPSVYLTMAKTLMPMAKFTSDGGEYFHEMSTNLFAALMAHFIREKSTNVAGDISWFLNRERKDVIEDSLTIAGQYPEIAYIRDELKGLSGLDDRTFPGVVKSISNKLSFTRFPDIAAYSSSPRSPAEHLAALEPDTDIFINIPALQAKDFASFSRLLIGAMYVASELLEQPDRPRARRLFLIDEARVLGGMEALTNVRDAGRSIGMHLMLIYQNYGQLNEAWGGDAGATAWLDSCEARVISAVGSSRTANDIVTMLGQRIVRTQVTSSSSSNAIHAPLGGSVSSSEQEQLRDVPLMSAATLGQLPPHGSLIFTRRSKPILASKAIYFTRPEMVDRVKSPDAVTEELASSRRRTAVMAGIDTFNTERGNTQAPDTQTPDTQTGNSTNEAGERGVAAEPTYVPEPSPVEQQAQAAPQPTGEDHHPHVEAPPVSVAESVEHETQPADDKAITGTNSADYIVNNEHRPGDGDAAFQATPIVQRRTVEPVQSHELPPVPDPPNPAQDALTQKLSSKPRLEVPSKRGELWDHEGMPHTFGPEDVERMLQAARNKAPDASKPQTPPVTKAAQASPTMAQAASSSFVSEPPEQDIEMGPETNLETGLETSSETTVETAVETEGLDVAVDANNEGAAGPTGAADQADSTNPASGANPVSNQVSNADKDTAPKSGSSDNVTITRIATPWGGYVHIKSNEGSRDIAPDKPDTPDTPDKEDGNDTTAATPVDDAADNTDAEQNTVSNDRPVDANEDAPASPSSNKPETDGSLSGNPPSNGAGSINPPSINPPSSNPPPDNVASDAEKDTAPPAARPPEAVGQSKHVARQPARKRKLSANEVRAALTPLAGDLFRKAFGEPVNFRAFDWRAVSSNAISMNMSPQKCGLWNNFSAGTGGDLFDLVAITMCDLPDARTDFLRVLRRAAKYAGVYDTVSQSGDEQLSEEEKKQRAKQAANQARKLRDAERRNNKYKVELVNLLRERAKPVAGTPAQVYLERRGIMDIPDGPHGTHGTHGTHGNHGPHGNHGSLGYLGPLDDLPERLSKLVYNPQHSALVIWAVDESGNVTGGQRILIDDEGMAIASQPNKPAFGTIGGNPARFYMSGVEQNPNPDDAVQKGPCGPLVVAEGPESALTICAATGYETWAVFGASGWKNAPLPMDRDIVLCPDRDPPDSPAEKAFNQAALHHLNRGCLLAVAQAPEEEGSKRDLNDTCRKEGYEPVRKAIEGAKPMGNTKSTRKNDAVTDKQPQSAQSVEADQAVDSIQAGQSVRPEDEPS